MRYLILVFLSFPFAAQALECPAGEQQVYVNNGTSFTDLNSAAENQYNLDFPSGSSSSTTSWVNYNAGVTKTISTTYTFQSAGGLLSQHNSTSFTNYYNYQVVNSCTVSDSNYSYACPESSNSTEDQTGSFTYSITCDVVDDTSQDSCSATLGDEHSFITQDPNATDGCINGCVYSVNNPDGSGKSVAVQFLSDNGDVHSFGYGTGQSCEASTSQFAQVLENAPYKLEYVEGVPTFTGTSIPSPVKLIASAGNEEIESQINALNSATYADVTNSTVNDQLNDAVISDDPIVIDSSGNEPLNITVSNVKNTETGETEKSYTVTVGTTRQSGSVAGGSGSDGSGSDGSGSDGSGSDGSGSDVDVSGIEVRLDRIEDAVNDIGDGTTFSNTEEIGDFETVTKEFSDRIKLAPIVSIGQNIAFPSGQGVCNELSINLPFGNVSTSLHCEVFDGVKNSISVVMLFVWGFFGIRIILSA